MLQSWADRREPPAIRARTAAAAAATVGSRKDADRTVQNDKNDQNDNDDDNDSFDLTLLFVSETGLPAPPPVEIDSDSDTGGRGGGGGDFWRGRGEDADDRFEGGGKDGPRRCRAGGAASPEEDMWGALSRELWGPWPQADVMVHIGSQVRAGFHKYILVYISIYIYIFFNIQQSNRNRVNPSWHRLQGHIIYSHKHGGFNISIAHFFFSSCTTY